jgi:hypothetical protein
MAKVDAYICDWADCSRMELAPKSTAGADTIPVGWIRIFPAGGGMKAVCSDRCNAEMAIARWEASNEGRVFARKRRK